MESFATVVRSLLERIRVLQTTYAANPWPPSAAAAAPRSHLYKVPPTAWGLDAEVLPPYRPEPDRAAASCRCREGASHPAAITPEDSELPASTTTIVERRTEPARSTRWRLDLAAHGLPQARGLLST